MNVRITKQPGLALGQMPIFLMPPPYNPQAYVMDDNREIMIKLRDWMVSKEQNFQAQRILAKTAMREPATQTVAKVANGAALLMKYRKRLQ